MAKQGFTIAFRESLWETHNEKCIYCERSILFKEMEVDHVIPESTSREDFEVIRSRLGLPSSFKTLGYENLAPSCRSCNQKKRDNPFADGYLMIVLTIISKKIPEVERMINRRRAERDLDRTIRILCHQVEKGEFTFDELLDGLESARQLPNGIFGSKSGAGPSSPEYAISNIRLGSRYRLYFTSHAEMRMAERGIDVDQLNDRIFEAVRDQNASFDVHADQDGQRRFTLTVANQWSVACVVSEEIIRVKTVEWLDR